MQFFKEPWKHQLEALERQEQLYLQALERAMERGEDPDPQSYGFGLFFEPGAGKTGTAINILRAQMNRRKKFLRTLVFCPPIVISNWKAEFAMHSKVPPEKIHLLTGAGKRRADIFDREAFKDGVPQPGIFVTNYEALLMAPLYAELCRWEPEAIIFDEAHKLKNSSAKRSKLAERLANGLRTKALKLILTGTPVLNNPMDLFMQFLILDAGGTFGGNFYAFRARFFVDKNASMPRHKYFPNWQIKDGALDEINRLVCQRSMSVKKEDCLDLPPLLRQTIKVPMSPEQRRLYLEMKNEFITFLGDKACTATLAITKALRLQQIASGYAKTVDGDEISLEDTPKMEALRELLEEITPTGKVLVWAVFKENYRQIRQVCDSLGVGYVEIHGEVSEKERNLAVHRLNDDPSVRVLIGHPGSGGIGVNLIAAGYSIFYSRNFSLEHSLQAEARNYRGGSEIHEKVTRYDLVCEGTIDELVSEKLANKVEVSDKILTDLSVEIRNQPN